MPQQTALSLFSNCGAGDFGFSQAGFRFVVMAEIRRSRLRVAALNHPDAAVVWDDLRDSWEDVVEQYRARQADRPDLLAACPPCQGMSTARRDRGHDHDAKAGARDDRNLLVVPIAKVAQAVEPRAIVVENVPPFFTRLVPHPESGDGVSAAALLASRLANLYEAFPLLVDLCDYGVPQHRKRAFMTFIHRDEKCLARLHREALVPYPKPTHASDHGGQPITLQEALEEMSADALDAASLAGARSNDGPELHSVPVWSDRIYRMVAAIPKRTGASAWENADCVQCGYQDIEAEAATCPVCQAVLPRPVVRCDDGSYRLVNGFRTSSYRRMDPAQPATTVTTANGRVGSSSTIHPWENRVLSALECSGLQTIPEAFTWGEAPLDRIGINELRAMIGEAVPPLFTAAHGSALVACLEDDASFEFLAADDDRCVAARRKLAFESTEAA